VDVHDPLQFRARRLANRIGGAFDAWDKYVEKMPSLKDKGIKFIFDEWGNRLRSASPNDSGGFRAKPECWCRSPTHFACTKCFVTPIWWSASCATGGLRTVDRQHRRRRGLCG
jgi:hypothetical protein